MTTIFAYFSLLRHQGIHRHYFGEITHALGQYFHFLVMPRNIDYIEWLVDSMLRVPVQHVLDSSYLGRPLRSRRHWCAPGRHNATARPRLVHQPRRAARQNRLLCRCPYQVSKLTPMQIARWKRLQRSIVLALPVLNPYIANDFSLIHFLRHPEPP